MPSGSADLLDLVGQLHEGIADESTWDRAFDRLATFLDIPHLVAGAISPDGRQVQFRFGHKPIADAVALLEGPLADPLHNPWITVGQRHPLRRPATVEDVGGLAALKQTRMWDEFYRPFGIGDTMAATLERQPSGADVMVIGRDVTQPVFSRDDQQRFAALLPHIARAWRVKHMLADWQARAGTLKFILDRLERAIVVAGPEGEVRFANRSADRLLGRGDAIDATRGRIRAARQRDSDALLGLVNRAARTATGTDVVATDAVAISRTDGGASLAIVAEPLAPAHSDTLGHSSQAGAVLFISDSQASTRPPEERLRLVYGLTPAEARLAALLVEGHDPASAARVLHISANTVKYHLKTLFEKIGVSRQSGLVRRVLADVGGLAEPETLRP